MAKRAKKSGRATKPAGSKKSAGSKTVGGRKSVIRPSIGRPKKASKKKAAKKVARRAAAGRAGSSKAAARTGGPWPEGSGSGVSAAEVGSAVVSLINAGTPDETIWARWFSPAFVSVEGEGLKMAWGGIDAVRGKNEHWMSTHQIHSARAEGPYAGATGFAIRFIVDVTDTTTGQRDVMNEVGVYTVRDGKVVREEFMYAIFSACSCDGGKGGHACPPEPEPLAPVGG